MFKDCMEVTLNRADLHTKCNIRNVFDLFEYAHFNLSIADVVHFCYEERDLWLCIFFKKSFNVPPYGCSMFLVLCLLSQDERMK
jgi:hypothetical protein